MNFQDLHELLRVELQRRIEAGELTGSRLAQQSGFRQPHLSNFLNRKRTLSMEGLDRVLAAQKITLDQLLPLEIRASGPETRESVAQDLVESIPVVTASAAIDEAQIQAASVIETIHVSVSRLTDNRVRASRRSADWQRFVAVRSDGQQAAAMEPMLTSDTIAVIDRHYNSLAPYRTHQPTLYAMRYGRGILLRYVEFDDGHLILRPSSMDAPVQLINVAVNEMPSDYIVGRVCLLLHEL